MSKINEKKSINNHVVHSLVVGTPPRPVIFDEPNHTRQAIRVPCFLPLESLVPALEADPEECEEKLGAVDSPVAILVELLHHRPELAGAQLQAKHLTQQATTRDRSKGDILRFCGFSVSCQALQYLDQTR